MVIEEYKDAMLKKDYKALAECFSADKCTLYDYCPSIAGKRNFYIHGKEAVDMFYHNQFILKGMSVADPIVLDERRVDFFIRYGGTIVRAIANIEAFEEGTGKISEMVIRPA